MTSDRGHGFDEATHTKQQYFLRHVNFKFEMTNMKTHTSANINNLEHMCLFFFLSSCHSIHTMEHEFYECPEYLSNTPAEVERTEEYEYEVQFDIFLLNVYE